LNSLSTLILPPHSSVKVTKSSSTLPTFPRMTWPPPATTPLLVAELLLETRRTTRSPTGTVLVALTSPRLQPSAKILTLTSRPMVSSPTTLRLNGLTTHGPTILLARPTLAAELSSLSLRLPPMTQSGVTILSRLVSWSSPLTMKPIPFKITASNSS